MRYDITFLWNNRLSLDLPHTLDRSSIPDVKDNKDLYIDIAHNLFLNWKPQIEKMAFDSFIGEKPSRLKEIDRLERDVADGVGGGETVSRVAALKAELELLEHRFQSYAVPKRQDKNYLSSKMTVSANGIQLKIVGSEWDVPKWRILYSEYAQPGLLVERDGNGDPICYKADWARMYTEEFLTPWQAITVLTVPGKRKSAGNVTRLDHPDGISGMPVHRFPTFAEHLHLSLQRWMVTDDWYNYVATTEEKAWIVPVTEPTDPEKVKKLEWYKQHPLVKRSGLLKKKETGSDAGSTRRDQSMSSTGSRQSMGPPLMTPAQLAAAAGRHQTPALSTSALPTSADKGKGRARFSQIGSSASPAPGVGSSGMPAGSSDDDLDEEEEEYDLNSDPQANRTMQEQLFRAAQQSGQYQYANTGMGTSYSASGGYPTAGFPGAFPSAAASGSGGGRGGASRGPSGYGYGGGRGGSSGRR